MTHNDIERLMAGVQRWVVRKSELVADCRIFKVRRDYATSPRTGQEHSLYVIDSVDWVNVVALTPQDDAVLVVQYRHGTRSVTLEVVGGLMEVGETPEQAALRELQEETGYTGSDARIIGMVHPNPAIQPNRTFTVLVTPVTLTAQQAQDEGEDVTVVRVPLQEIPDLMRREIITHSLTVAAFHWLSLETPSRC